ncbi:hypothetical protein CDG77_19255 [Nostoc sp. 'Peltigera membranacea cyanobiont' 213]|nr:hypothetical protein CDG77_19255 [Nostoc sp. 'Peltigera membranacea cyanobiont' 213]
MILKQQFEPLGVTDELVKHTAQEIYSVSQSGEIQEPHPQPPPRKRGGGYDVTHVIKKRYIKLCRIMIFAIFR